MKKILFIFLILLSVSCDGGYYSELLIIDSETYKPIKKVTISRLDKDIKAYSDENGYFEESFTTGAPFGRTEVSVVISKENYVSDTITLKNQESQFVKMVKEENK